MTHSCLRALPLAFCLGLGALPRPACGSPAAAPLSSTALSAPAPYGGGLGIIGFSRNIGSFQLFGLNLRREPTDPSAAFELSPADDHLWRYFRGWSPDGATVAYSETDGSNSWVCTLSLADGTMRRLALGDEPCWAPDGRRIAFIRSDPGSQPYACHILVMGADGTSVTALTQGAFEDGGPAWSPDGAKIAFTSNREGKYQVFVMASDGRGLRNLTRTQNHESQPCWSPDGRRLAFKSTRDGHPQVYAMDADGGHPRNLSNDPTPDSGPSWSPDGRYLAFDSYRDSHYRICVMKADGSDQRALTPGDAVDRSPKWR